MVQTSHSCTEGLVLSCSTVNVLPNNGLSLVGVVVAPKRRWEAACMSRKPPKRSSWLKGCISDFPFYFAIKKRREVFPITLLAVCLVRWQRNLWSLDIRASTKVHKQFRTFLLPKPQQRLPTNQKARLRFRTGNVSDWRVWTALLCVLLQQ